VFARMTDVCVCVRSCARTHSPSPPLAMHVPSLVGVNTCSFFCAPASCRQPESQCSAPHARTPRLLRALASSTEHTSASSTPVSCSDLSVHVHFPDLRRGWHPSWCRRQNHRKRAHEHCKYSNVLLPLSVLSPLPTLPHATPLHSPCSAPHSPLRSNTTLDSNCS
jgi:hypothetical protein